MKAFARWSGFIALFLLVACNRERVTHETRSVDTPTGKAEMKVTTYPKGTKSIGVVLRELTTEELGRLDRDAGRSKDFVRRYAPTASGDALVQLDAAFAGWLRADDSGKESASDVIRIVGAAYGRYCIQRLGVRWAIIQDEYGIDTALVKSNPEARSYPFTSIQYRIEDQKTDFIGALYAAFEDTIERSKAEANKAPEPTPVSVTPRATETISK